MLTTAFISMWITNTATTAMMTPIMEAVLKELDKEYLGESDEDEDERNGNANDGNLENGVDIKNTDKEKEIGITNDVVELKELGLSEAPSRSSSTRKLVTE